MPGWAAAIVLGEIDPRLGLSRRYSTRVLSGGVTEVNVSRPDPAICRSERSAATTSSHAPGVHPR